MSDDTNGPDGFDPSLPSSLLPYDTWLEDAQRNVMLKALDYVGEHGLPGDHHFYMTFLTNLPGVDIPARLKERYPEEMTIVLQHQFQNLTVDRKARSFSVGLSFGGIPSTLHIPFGAITAFADPHIHLVLRFSPGHDTPEEDGEDIAAGHTAPPAGENSPAEILDFQSSAQGASHGSSQNTAGEQPDAPTETGEPETEEKDSQAEIVSLAAFRKKPTGDSHSSPDGKDS